ncbi:alpha-isopropylmalate synthase regulatory domain-containing protein [Dietzia sp. NPDC055343]
MRCRSGSRKFSTSETGGRAHTRIALTIDDDDEVSVHTEVGPVEALTRALAAGGIDVEVLSLHQTSVGAGSQSEALTLVEFRAGADVRWTAGRDRSVLAATLAAVTAAANDLWRAGSTAGVQPRPIP